MVAEKCAQNHIISEKYRTVLSFKLHVLHSIPLLKLGVTASNCKNVENIPGSHFVKAFSVLSSHS
jgi:hypothetical protein